MIIVLVRAKRRMSMSMEERRARRWIARGVSHRARIDAERSSFYSEIANDVAADLVVI